MEALLTLRGTIRMIAKAGVEAEEQMMTKITTAKVGLVDADESKVMKITTAKI